MSRLRGGTGGRWAVVALAWFAGAGAALAFHAPPDPLAPPEDLRAELDHARRSQSLLRAESTVRLLRALEAHESSPEVGP